MIRALLSLSLALSLFVFFSDVCKLYQDALGELAFGFLGKKKKKKKA